LNPQRFLGVPMQTGKRKLLAVLVTLLTAVSMSSISATADGFHNVEIKVWHADGTPAQGQQVTAGYDSKRMISDSDGYIRLELPSGTHGFSGSFFPSGSADNLTIATTNFQATIDKPTAIELVLPRSNSGSLLLEDPNGNPINHAPLQLVMLCSNTIEIQSKGLVANPTLWVSPPRFVSKSLDGGRATVGGWNRDLALRAKDGRARVEMFEVPLRDTDVTPSEATSSLEYRCNDLGGDRVRDFLVKTARHLEWQLLDGSKILAGTEKISVPDAPQFKLNLPMKVDIGDFQVRLKTTGVLSASHPSILARHGAIAGLLLQGYGSMSPGTKRIDGSGNFSFGFEMNKRRTRPAQSFALTTAMGFQSQEIPVPPSFNFFWIGQTLTVSVEGITPEMGRTQFTHGKTLRFLSPTGSGAEIKLNKATPVSKAQFTNALYEGALQIRTSYAHCNHLWKVFDGGIALSANAKNKGAKSEKVPTVWPSAYNQSKRLDRDRDGIVCER
jgi:hypothetical protein